MGAETFVNSPVGGKRSTRRARVLLAARLETPFGEVDARLRDLSRKGALVECAKQPPVGSEVVFKRGSTIVPARVAWTAAGRVGLEFLYMIDEQEVLVQLKKNSSGSNFERFRRPGLNEGLSDQERKLAQAWGVTVGLSLPDGEL
jgi:PilZ domain